MGRLEIPFESPHKIDNLFVDDDLIIGEAGKTPYALARGWSLRLGPISFAYQGSNRLLLGETH